VLTGDIIALILDTYSDNVTVNADENVVVESRWKRDMEKEIPRIIKEHLRDAVASL
jgi:hypothetical protein